MLSLEIISAEVASASVPEEGPVGSLFPRLRGEADRGGVQLLEHGLPSGHGVL